LVGSGGSGTANATTPWASSAAGIAMVDNAGLVTGVAVGTAIITYMDSHGCTNAATVTVNVGATQPTITGPTSTCNTVVIDAGAGYSSYLWSNQDMNQITIVLMP